jgi:hypothetical protein
MSLHADRTRWQNVTISMFSMKWKALQSELAFPFFLAHYIAVFLPCWLSRSLPSWLHGLWQLSLQSGGCAWWSLTRVSSVLSPSSHNVVCDSFLSPLECVCLFSFLSFSTLARAFIVLLFCLHWLWQLFLGWRMWCCVNESLDFPLTKLAQPRLVCASFLYCHSSSYVWDCISFFCPYISCADFLTLRIVLQGGCCACEVQTRRCSSYQLQLPAWQLHIPLPVRGCQLPKECEGNSIGSPLPWGTWVGRRRRLRGFCCPC